MDAKELTNVQLFEMIKDVAIEQVKTDKVLMEVILEVTAKLMDTRARNKKLEDRIKEMELVLAKFGFNGKIEGF